MCNKAKVKPRWVRLSRDISRRGSLETAPLPAEWLEFNYEWVPFKIYHQVDWFHQPVSLYGVSRGYFFSLGKDGVEIKRWVRDTEIPLAVLILALLQGDEAWRL